MAILTGWHTLKIDDVLPTVSTPLRMYATNRPALKMRSRRHYPADGVNAEKDENASDDTSKDAAPLGAGV